MKSNNKGFSLIELIVVVLIMGIIAGGAIYAYNVVHNARTSGAASVLANELRQARQKAISVANTTNDEGVSQVYLHLYTTSDGLHADIYKDSEKLVEEKLGNDTVSVSLRQANVTNPANIISTITIGATDAHADAKIYFKKSSGAISKITVGGADKSDMNELYITGLGEDQRIVLVKATGRAYYAD